ncbi:MAG TPA: SRPBCC family protein [Gaiellaceae bacterium]
MREASLDLLASRADVWGFLAEPYHLTDWWPGLTGVEPDRRGFAPGARWKAIVRARNVLLGSRPKETLLLVREVDPYERFAFHVLATKLDVEVRLATVGEDRTRVTVATSRGPASLPRTAVKRLYDLVQTAAGL